MNILVTGCAGFIGSVTTEILVNKGHKVIGLDNFSSSYRESVNRKIRFYEGDIEDADIVNEIFLDNDNIDYVFHFAAESIIGKSMTDPACFFRTNVGGGMILLNIMKKYNVKKLIHSSTASTYGNPIYSPIDENHPQNPINAYGESKLMFETILKWYQKCYGLDYVMFRYFNVGGSTLMNGERRKWETRLLPTIMRCIQNGEKLKIFGSDYPTEDGTAIRDYLHVVDVAQAHILAMENFEKVKNDVYNLGSQTGYSILEIVDLCRQVTEHGFDYEFTDRRLGDPVSLVCSNKKAIEKLGWNPELSNLQQIIYDTARWFGSL
jgi:UDP-glucose 4-epimerase